LDEMLDRELANYYHTNREAHPEFRNEDGSWKLLEAVQSEVAELYLASILQAIQVNHPEIKTANLSAPLRFHAYLQKMRSQLEKDPSAPLVAQITVKGDGTKLTERPALADQWKLVQESVRVQRGDGIEDQSIFTLASGSWSSIHPAANGDISFIHIEQVGESALDPVAAAKKLNQLKQLVAGEAQRTYMGEVVEELKAKQAISLAYLKQPIETVEVPIIPEDL
jgi:hypothetical protein